MNIEIGEYIRNQYGIAKVIDITPNTFLGVSQLKLDKKIAFIIDKETKEIKKMTDILPLTKNIHIAKIRHSFNIIDLIEVRRLCEWSRN